MSELVVVNNKQFKDAVKRKESIIRVNNSSLASKIKVLMRVPAASFVGASVALGVAIFSVATAHTEVVTAPMTGGASGIIRFGAGAASSTLAFSLLGSATGPVIALGVALGGISLLTNLFNEYKIIDSGSGYVVLKRK